MEIKKSETADLRKNIWTYVLTGLAFMLLLSWQALEVESQEIVMIEPDEGLDTVQIQEEDVPIMMMLDTPPPPPPPPVIPEKIEIVEDEKEIVETILAPTETTITEEVKEVKVTAVAREARVAEVIDDVPFAVIENVPVYPGCEDKKNNDDRKKCMSEKITSFVNKNFNTGLANEQGLEGRQTISVQFKIDKSGEVVGVLTKAKNAALQREAERVINKLPKMIPGKQRGKPVGVIYGLPIVFQVQD
jgi:protein TonB